MQWQSSKNRDSFFKHTDDVDTVLILGAGASAHLKYPLGPGLNDNILKSTEDPSSEAFGQLMEMGFAAAQIGLFHQTLSKFCAASIDEFLAAQTSFTDIGRAAIAQELIRRARDRPGGRTPSRDQVFQDFEFRFVEIGHLLSSAK